jgi:hypothetical protein
MLYAMMIIKYYEDTTTSDGTDSNLVLYMLIALQAMGAVLMVIVIWGGTYQMIKNYWHDFLESYKGRRVALHWDLWLRNAQKNDNIPASRKALYQFIREHHTLPYIPALPLSVFNAEYEKQMHKPVFLFEPTTKPEEAAGPDPAILVPFMLPTLALGGASSSASRIPPWAQPVNETASPLVPGALPYTPVVKNNDDTIAAAEEEAAAEEDDEAEERKQRQEEEKGKEREDQLQEVIVTPECVEVNWKKRRELSSRALTPLERSPLHDGGREAQVWSPQSNMSDMSHMSHVSLSHTDVLKTIAQRKLDVADCCAVCSLMDRQRIAAHPGLCPRVPAVNPLEEATESNMALWTKLSLCHSCFRPQNRDHVCSSDCTETKSQFLDIIGFIFLSDDVMVRRKLQTFLPDCPELQPTDEAILYIGMNIGEVIDVLEIET